MIGHASPDAANLSNKEQKCHDIGNNQADAQNREVGQVCAREYHMQTTFTHSVIILDEEVTSAT